ncbi:DUF5009 domain-containing protein [Luteolibacter ambystomatis]|uniref:DUF5009 domain-containing protein n=1 Tax=Luteolibacter ambystomatis TaxID=2824561 RepID=A0A975G9T0_9BACT|nr:DUF5009 domain-containing protein [Luteolibacter ambystomatis]QUE51431.1 DUF5009 domain-containing protein [Luteolibacter ambystomatis]
MTDVPTDTKPPRLLSLDALRGFDMLWIIGAETIVHQLAKWHKTPWLHAWATQLSHVSWEGLRAYDLIFPLFMFLSGVAIPFSFESRLVRGDSKRRLAGKIVIRSLVLVLLGMIYNGLLSDQPGPPRLPSVLGQIGLAWGAAATLNLLVRGMKGRLACIAAILGIVTVLQLLVPVPGIGASELTKTGAINAWLDRLLVPGRLHGKTFDPEGLLCIFSATTLTLAGSVLGSVLRKPDVTTWRTAGFVFAAGAAVTGAGWLCWHSGYPPIKALWTPTFDLLAIGIALMVFALFFAVIDVAKFQKWTLPLRVIGMNALTIYLLTRLVDFDQPSTVLFGRLANACGDGKLVVIASGALLLEWAVLYFLYRRKIFLRV